MMDTYRTWIQAVSATRSHVGLQDKWSKISGSLLVLVSIMVCSMESLKTEERLLLWRTFILVMNDRRAAAGNVDQTRVGQQGLQTELQLGEELHGNPSMEKNMLYGLYVLKSCMSSFIFRVEGKYSSELQSDEEDLEPPLPLRSDDEWQHYSRLVPPQCWMHKCGKEIDLKRFNYFSFAERTKMIRKHKTV